MNVTKEVLNKIATEYHDKDAMNDKFIEDAAQIYTQKWVFEQMEGCRSVLELGFGEGHFTHELVERGFDTTVIDGSDFLLGKAKELYGDRIKVVHSLFEEFVPQEKYDCVLATHVLEHVDEPVILLKHMKNWISANGRLSSLFPIKSQFTGCWL